MIFQNLTSRPARPSRQIVPIAILIFAIACGIIQSAVAQEQSPLVVSTGDRCFVFNVELATDNASRSVGLMNRAEMAADAGMLFQFESVRPIFMWMKNTLISLDMIFIDTAGIVNGIHENAVPGSEAIIASPKEALYVLELNGGSAAKLDLKVGHQIFHRLIEGAGILKAGAACDNKIERLVE